MSKTKRDLVPKMIRLPREMKRWIEKEAERNGGTESTEIVRCVRERMDRAQPPISVAQMDQADITLARKAG
jgi:hypothetical protein